MESLNFSRRVHLVIWLGAYFCLADEMGETLTRKSLEKNNFGISEILLNGRTTLTCTRHDDGGRKKAAKSTKSDYEKGLQIDKLEKSLNKYFVEIEKKEAEERAQDDKETEEEMQQRFAKKIEEEKRLNLLPIVAPENTEEFLKLRKMTTPSQLNKNMSMMQIRDELRNLHYRMIPTTWEKDEEMFYEYLKNLKFRFIGLFPPGEATPAIFKALVKEMDAVLRAHVTVCQDAKLSMVEKIQWHQGRGGLIDMLDDVIAKLHLHFVDIEKMQNDPAFKKKVADSLTRVINAINEDKFREREEL